MTREDDRRITRRDQLKRDRIGFCIRSYAWLAQWPIRALCIHIANLYVCIREGMLVDQVMSAWDRTTGRRELKARERGKRKNRGIKARKKGREKERERKRTFPSISIWRCVESLRQAFRPIFLYFFFYLMYIHDRVSHDDIGLWDWIIHTKHN